MRKAYGFKQFSVDHFTTSDSIHEELAGKEGGNGKRLATGEIGKLLHGACASPISVWHRLHSAST